MRVMPQDQAGASARFEIDVEDIEYQRQQQQFTRAESEHALV